MNYNLSAQKQFENSLNKFKSWRGINALDWGMYVQPVNFNEKLNKKLVRSDLLNENFTNALTDFELTVAILSWGGMNREHAKTLYKNNDWINLVSSLRSKEINSRKEAYNEFYKLRKGGKLKGMGPAYFTKLICFANPKLNGFIMDQWTSKSINLLCDKELIKLTKSGHVKDNNTPDIYELFCEIVEDLSKKYNVKPIVLEENLFSNGGFNKGSWRKYVVNNWGVKNKKNINQPIKDKILEPIDFEAVLNKLSSENIEIPSLGGRSRLKIRKDDDKILITNSKQKSFSVNKQHWDKVMNRMDELPQDERDMTSRYGLGKHSFNWKECPNRVFSIYIPAIVKCFS